MSKRIEISDRNYEFVIKIMKREDLDSFEKTISYLVNQDDLLNYRK